LVAIVNSQARPLAVHLGEVLLEQRAEGRRVVQIPHLRLITN
jgi:hypothetical protein